MINLLGRAILRGPDRLTRPTFWRGGQEQGGARWRNQGWRAFLLLHAGLLLALLIRYQDFSSFIKELLVFVAFVEPALCLTLAFLFRLRKHLQRLPLLLCALALPSVLAGVEALVWQILIDPQVRVETAMLWAAVAAILLTALMDLLERARAPALAEARLMALNARIRPHFLFNSLNAVLGVIRSEPRRAETALEGLAELMRVMMRENTNLALLSEEIALARQYLDLEKLRLGERLTVDWDTHRAPTDALAPPMMLQPLLENAVYHGIEPLPGGGVIKVQVAHMAGQVIIHIANPHTAEYRHRPGNRMALANIRERLALFFASSARLDTDQHGGIYTVTITIPYQLGKRE